MKVKAQPALYLLDAARALRMEKDRERDLALQKEQESKIMSGLQVHTIFIHYLYNFIRITLTFFI